MTTQIVVAVYRPHPGKAEEMAALITRHVPLLRRQGLATDRAPIVMRSADGSFVEVFEWDPAASDVPPHLIPAVREIWDAMEAIGDFATLSDLPESAGPHPSFTPV